jgi:hypothetical protein
MPQKGPFTSRLKAIYCVNIIVGSLISKN